MGCLAIIFFGFLWMVVMRLNMVFYESVFGLPMSDDTMGGVLVGTFIFIKSIAIVGFVFMFLQGLAENYQEMRRKEIFGEDDDNDNLK